MRLFLLTAIAQISFGSLLHAATISGTVSDSATKDALADVAICIGDDPKPATSTDAAGKFSISVETTSSSRMTITKPPLNITCDKGVITWVGYRGEISIRVFDIRGAEITRFHTYASQGSSHFSISHLPAGCHLVKIKTENGIGLFKVLNLKNRSTHFTENLSNTHNSRHADAPSALAKSAAATLRFSKAGYATKYVTVTGSQNGLQVKMRAASMDDSTPGLPPMPDDVKNNNTQLMLGKVRGVVLPIKWADLGCNHTQADLIKASATLAERYHMWSRGRVQLVGQNGSGTHFNVLTVDQCAVPYNKASSNQTPAEVYLKEELSIPSSVLRWYVNSGASGPNAGNGRFDTHSGSFMTASHELGHLFRLGHGEIVIYNNDGTFKDINGYGDRTTNMGNVSGGGFNLPHYHRLKWIDEDDVAVFKKEFGSRTYRIRAIQKWNDSNTLAGVVYYLPVSGNRMWISVTSRDVYADKYLGNKLALTKYQTGWHMNKSMQSSLCINHMAGAHSDDFGLTYEVVDVDKSSNRGWAEIKISYDPKKDICNKPLVIKPALKLLKAPAKGVRGKMEVTITVRNPNLPTTTPLYQQRNDFKVPGAARVKLSKMSDSKFMMTVLPGGSSRSWTYTVESKPGPLAPETAKLRGEFRIMHLNPFGFDINFE